MSGFILPSVACLSLPNFSTLSRKRHDFWENAVERKMSVSIFSINFSDRSRSQQDVSVLVCRSLCKVPANTVKFNGTEFSRQIVEKSSNFKFHGNPSSGNRVVPCRRTDGLTHKRADGQKDMTELIVVFRNFFERAK